MDKVKFIVAATLFIFLIASGGIVYADAPYHIGIVTGTVSQGEDELRGAEKLIEDYGDASSGGMIAHVTYPDNIMLEMDTVISLIVGLADDPLMKAIVVNQSIHGTTEAFRRVKEKRPDILCFAAEAQADPGVISSTADLVTGVNDVYRGYLIPVAAKMMGATDFVHISFPRHMSYELLSRRRNIMEAVCKDIGVNFHFETAPDPVSDVGVAGAQQFILEKVPAWLDKYGPKTAFFNTNVAHVEPLIRQIVAYGGYYVESSVPSPLRGYPGALGLDLTAEKGNFPAIMKKIEEVIIQKGASGRLGTWAYSCGYAESAGLVELARRIIDGEAEMTIEDLVDAYEKYTPGSEWNGSYYVDLSTGIEKTNYLLVYLDTYVFGRGFLGLTKLVVPEDYLSSR